MIETQRLILRQWEANDLESLHRIVSDPTTMSFWPTPFTREATEAWIACSLKSYRDNGFGRWAVQLRESDEIIGDCGIIRAEVNGVMEYDLGYIIHHPHWRKGYGYESAAECMRYGFETLGINRFVANMATDNIASARVAEKLGMQLERTFNNPRNRGLETYLYSLER